MPRFRKKPVVIEAVRFDSSESAEQIIRWAREYGVAVTSSTEIRNCSPEHPDGFDYPCLLIPTLEGTHTASVGDWVLKGIKNEFYPCKPEIFEATYEAVED